MYFSAESEHISLFDQNDLTLIHIIFVKQAVEFCDPKHISEVCQPGGRQMPSVLFTSL
jgi:hypothetical protein